MDSIKHRWKRSPDFLRKSIVLIVGMLFVIASVLTGWLPGPGGIPLFLVGIAILATEFEWATRLRDRVLAWIRQAGQWIRAHKLLGTVAIICGIAVAVSLSIVAYRSFK